MPLPPTPCSVLPELTASVSLGRRHQDNNKNGEALGLNSDGGQTMKQSWDLVFIEKQRLQSCEGTGASYLAESPDNPEETDFADTLEALRNLFALRF